jgi:hypothetical protein
MSIPHPTLIFNFLNLMMKNLEAALWKGYFPAAFRLEAFKGFSSLVIWGAFSFTRCVAKLQSRLDHFVAGSGQAIQYNPVGNSTAR